MNQFMIALTLLTTAGIGGGTKDSCYGISFDGACLTKLNAASSFSIPSKHLFEGVEECEESDGSVTSDCVLLTTRTSTAVLTHRLTDTVCSGIAKTANPCYGGYVATEKMRSVSAATVSSDQLDTLTTTVIREPNGRKWKKVLTLESLVEMSVPWVLSTGQELYYTTTATKPDGTVLWEDEGGYFMISSTSDWGSSTPAVIDYCAEVASHAGDSLQQAYSDGQALMATEGEEAGAMYLTGVGAAHALGSVSRAFYACLSAPQKFAPSWYTESDAQEYDSFTIHAEQQGWECPAMARGTVTYNTVGGQTCTIEGIFECTPDCTCTIQEYDLDTKQCE